tara:strand:- start:199 stop:711 length:513 start_codon:yes stop_codon:yes gene_type:complete
MDFDKINESIINLNTGSNKDNLFEFYKTISFKLIFSCESTIYKISDNENIKTNLLNYNTNFIISDYFKQIFECIKFDGFNSEIDNIIFELIKLTDDSKHLIILKIFYLVDNFYKYLIREQLQISNYEIYKKSFIRIFNEYYKFNTIEIFGIILNKDFKLDTDFNLTLEEY